MKIVIKADGNFSFKIKNLGENNEVEEREALLQYALFIRQTLEEHDSHSVEFTLQRIEDRTHEELNKFHGLGI